ncbi:MAG: hypothetical protein R3C26_22630 [Calditrichia bacterium]
MLRVSIAGIGCNLLFNVLLIPQFQTDRRDIFSAITQWMILILSQ